MTLQIHRFGEFTLDPRERRLVRGSEPVTLAGKPFDLLVALVRNAGRLVTKDELLELVWPGVVVDEVNLSVNVSALRKLLGDDWIETVPRQGYRFRGDVETVDRASAPASTRRTRSARWTVAAGVLASLALLAAFLWAQREPRYAAIAVLPLHLEDKSQAHVADGLVEGIMDKLAQARDLRVAARASAFRLRGVDPMEVGRTLGSPAVLTGSLSSDADQIALQLELLDVARRQTVWRHGYSSSRAELPQLAARIAADVMDVAGVRTADRADTARRLTADSEAYQQYLLGRYQWNLRSESALNQSIVHFERAVALDPNFALAHAGLADSYTALGYLGYVTPVSTFPAARPHALKALELDPSLGQAHAALAYIKFYFDWDWRGAQDEFRQALALNPNDAVAHQWYAVYLRAAGRAEDAQREIEIAQRLDPLSLAINTDVGFHHYYAGRYPEAIAQLQTVLAMKQDFLLAHLWLGRTLLQVGRHEEALAETLRAEAGARDWPVIVTARGFAYGVMGRKEEARGVLREMEALSGHRFVTAYGMALVHAGLGDKDNAFAWLDKAFEERSHWLVWLRLDPRWNALRADPRFDALVARMKYPA